MSGAHLRVEYISPRTTRLGVRAPLFNYHHAIVEIAVEFVYYNIVRLKLSKYKRYDLYFSYHRGRVLKSAYEFKPRERLETQALIQVKPSNITYYATYI